MLVPTSGAQRASRQPSQSRTRSRPIVGAIVAASILASLIAVPASAATTSSAVRIPVVAPVVTSTINRSWLPEELLVLGMTNCTRTGGWVQSNGTCKGYGSGRYSTYVAPLRLSAAMSDTVSRPYARLLAVKAKCSHFLDGDPGRRLRRAGFTSYTWGENIGCRDGYSWAKPAVIASHLNFQAEKSSNGGHWKNIKNPKFKYIGIGVWRTGSRTRLVTDFYG